ncbi:MAG: radical SAM family heme chaperone HemW [Duncaniella sp.]|nr:radical SAM family heme chaperone HemW [Duncaniella sp.]
MTTANTAYSAPCAAADKADRVKLYVHVPFCRSKCAYCDFYSNAQTRLVPEWLDMAGREWQALSGGRVPDTIYIGGGTPSVLSTVQLDRLISMFPCGDLREFTIEVNPEDVSEEFAAHLTGSTPVDRVSMGIQTFDDGSLRSLGRRHTAARALEAFETLRRAGVANISCDLIYGLPGQTLAGWKENLKRLLDMRPEHISAYLLSFEPRTRLGLMLSRGEVAETPEGLAEEMYASLCELTRAAGYEHYEISNFALPGRRAIHNSAYWDGSDYLGLGPGAHSLIGGQRWYNPSNLTTYLNSEPGQARVMDEEDDASRFNDLIITALRTSAGLDTARVPEKFAARFLRDATRAIARGDLIATPTPTGSQRLTIPESRWLISDSILLDLIE